MWTHEQRTDVHLRLLVLTGQAELARETRDVVLVEAIDETVTALEDLVAAWETTDDDD